MNFALTFLMFLISFASLTYNVRNIRISSRKLTHERQLVNELTEQVNRMSDDYLRLKSEYDEVSFEYWGAMQQISKIRADFESKSDPEF